MRVARMVSCALGAVAFFASIAGAVMLQKSRRATERAEQRERALDARLQRALAGIASRDSALAVARAELRGARIVALSTPQERLPALPDSYVVALAEDVALTPIAAAGFSEAQAIPIAPVPAPTIAALPGPSVEAPPFMLPPLHVSYAMRPPMASGFRGAPQVYALAFVAGDGLNAWLHIDRDPGGYVDSWNTIDKLAHGAMGAVITQSALSAGVPRRWAAPITCAGAVGFEMSQGYVSWKDAIAGCSGAVIATAIDKLSERLRP